MLNENFVIVGAIINLIGTSYYVIGTLQGKIKPNRVTFLLWAFAPLVAFAAEIKQGVGIQSLITLVAAIGPLAIFIASFINKKSYWKLTRFDFICGALSLLGLLLWAITRQGNLAIIFAILADALASIPTVAKAYHHPETEAAFPWLTSAIGGLLTILTITQWNFAHYAFPIDVLITNLLIFILVQFNLKRFKLI